MRITTIECLPVWGGFRNFLFVVVDTDEGISGVGEAGITGRELAVIGAIEHFKPLLIGQDPFRTEHLWQLLFRGGFFPAQRIIAAAISAIDIALWDIKGKALGVPIYELLGGRVRDKVVCYPHNVGHGMDVAPLVESLSRKPMKPGWKFVRWGLAGSGRHAGAARRGAGGDRAVPGRARGGRRRDRARLRRPHAARPRPMRSGCARRSSRSGRSSSKIRCAPRTPTPSRRCGRARRVPLAAGEQFSSKWEFRQLIEEEWIDYARIDLCIVGGFTEASKIAGWCETHYIKLALHNPLGPVSIRGLPAAQPGLPELRRAGAAAPHRHGAHRCGAGAARVGGRLPAALRPAPAWGSSSTARPRPAPIPAHRAATSAACGWLVHQLVKAVRFPTMRSLKLPYLAPG